MDRIQGVRLFIRVVGLGSFSKAAADLGIGQPSATKLVAQLRKSSVRGCCIAPRAA